MGKRFSENINNQSFRLNVPASKSKSEAWSELMSKMDEPVKKEQPKVKQLVWYSSVAAVALIIITISLVSRLSVQTIYETGFAQTEELVLPDSSIVKLASNSSLSFRQNKLSGKRENCLSGEAFFDVKEGEGFTVKFSAGEIKVLGTRFYVSAYENDFVDIACSEGRVHVDIEDTSYILEAGNGILYQNGTIKGPFEINVGLIENRNKGVYYWNGVQLQNIIQLLGNRYGYDVDISQVNLDRKFTGRLPLSNLPKDLDVVSVAMQLNFEIDEEQKVIRFENR